MHATTTAPTNGAPTANPTRIHHVLLATNLDKASAGAADEAIELASDNRAVLQILAVARNHRERNRLERGTAAIRERARAAGVTATACVWHGDPAEAILEAAWSERPDMLVLGARPHRDLRRLLGSVSARVAASAPCKVMIVPG
jgi:nucleotide-binding universal stress UspA family protein